MVVVGAGASGVDTSRELAAVCTAVHGAALGAGGGRMHREVEELLADGTVRFCGGGACRADAVVLCTGYRYDFPFLDDDGHGSSGQQDSGGALLHETRDAGAVAPLYRHVFAAATGGQKLCQRASFRHPSDRAGASCCSARKNLPRSSA